MNGDEGLGKEVILENERVRVWEDSAAVRETGTLHTHRRPYVAVVIAGDRAEAIAPDGSVLRGFHLEPGMTLYFGENDLPVTHALKNSGAKDIIIRVIELL